MLKDERLDIIQREYERKATLLDSYGECVSPVTVYEDIYGDLDQLVPVVLIDGDTKHIVKMSVYEALDMAPERDDILLGGTTYFKEYVSKATARDTLCFIIDMDNVWSGVLEDALRRGWDTEKSHLPMPTYIVNSGTGLHLYFVLSRPIPHYKKNAELVTKLYRLLANQQTTGRMYLAKQVQWFGQDFRMVGSLNKYGWINQAYRVGDVWDPDALAEQVGLPGVHFISYDEPRKTEYPSRKKKIVRRKGGGYRNYRQFYDATLHGCRERTKEGTRYMSMCAIVTVGYKCGIDVKEIERDLLSLLPKYNEGARRQIKVEEIAHALRMYNDKALRTPHDRLEDWMGWKYKGCRRNGRTREAHLRRARAVQALDYPQGEWRNKEGRPEKKAVVETWRREHPNGTKTECAKELGVSRSTVYKWWGS